MKHFIQSHAKNQIFPQNIDSKSRENETEKEADYF